MFQATPVADLINTVIQLYIYVLIAAAVLSWLLAFGIVNRHNPVVNGVGRFCGRSARSSPLSGASTSRR